MAASRRKYEFGTELFVLCISRRCGTDAEWEVQRAQGSVDWLGRRDVFVLSAEKHDSIDETECEVTIQA